MKVLIDINHPAHVHFFKNLRILLIDSGNSVIVTASRKDVAFNLLEEMDIPFTSLGTYGKNVIRKLLNVPVMALKMFRLAKKEKPDIMLGLASSRITHAGFLLNIPSFVFTDTEHATLQIALYKYFATKIITPNTFELDFGKKHITYESFHDLAYLHPEVFQAQSNILEKYNLDSNKLIFLVRFISWQASHDVGQSGLSISAKRKIIHVLEKYGQVLLFSEDQSDEEFEKYRYSIKGSDIHHIMGFAKMYIGEGGTMASESAVLGIPSILINTLTAGVNETMEKKYDLIYRSLHEKDIILKIEEWLKNDNLKDEFQAKRKVMLDQNINPNPYFMSLIANQLQKDKIL